MVAGPDGRHVGERDDLERLGVGAVQIRGDDHLVIEAVDRIVEVDLVEPELDARDAADRLQVVQRGPDPRRQVPGFADQYDMIWSEALPAFALAPVAAEGA